MRPLFYRGRHRRPANARQVPAARPARVFAPGRAPVPGWAAPTALYPAAAGWSR